MNIKISPTKISIIILNWNGKELLQQCLDSIDGQSYRDFETILVDNGSSDGSAEYVSKYYPWVKLVVLSENIGFASGNNRGLAECGGEYIVTLNNDTKVEPEFLSRLCAAADADQRIGMVAAKMLNFFDAGRIDSVGIKVTTSGMAYNIGVGERDQGQYDLPREVFGACAGAALYRRTMLDEVGFFDDDFFAYYEDVDLAWRGQLAGWRCITAPAAVVYHIHSATSGKMSPFTVYQVQRNKWFVIIKNWPGRLILRQFVKIILYDIGALLLALLKLRFYAAMRSRLYLLCNLRQLYTKRQEVKKLHKINLARAAQFLENGYSPLTVFRRKMSADP